MGMRNGLVGLVALAALSGCGGGVVTSAGPGQSLPALGDVTDAQWAALARRQVFFGHQSVGNNMMDGVARVLADNPGIRLTVLESKDLDSAQVPAIRHANVGRNFFPLEKMDEFVQVASHIGTPGGVAMVKLCFVDVEPDSDPQALFDDYRRRMDDLRTRHPGLTIVHFTMPLTTVENWKGNLKKTVLGRPTERGRSRVRNRYNQLLLQAYEGREPVFDIARLESTLPDGGRTFFRSGADTVFVLAEEHTNDGGHLTPAARRMVAEQFLIMLARLPQAASGAPAT